MNIRFAFWRKIHSEQFYPSKQQKNYNKRNTKIVHPKEEMKNYNVLHTNIAYECVQYVQMAICFSNSISLFFFFFACFS